MNKHMVGEFTVLLKEHHPYEQAYGWGVNSLIIKGAPPLWTSIWLGSLCMEIKNMTAKYGNKNISVVGILEGR